MDEELYILSEEHGTGKIVSINEDDNTAKIEYEDGYEEDVDLDDEFVFNFDDEEELEEEETIEEGRGKRGAARQASKYDLDDDDYYEKKGNKPNKGRFSLDRIRKKSFQESSDLLGLALDKKPTEFSTEFANILQSRISDKLEDLKLNIAQNLYNKENEIENL